MKVAVTRSRAALIALLAIVTVALLSAPAPAAPLAGAKLRAISPSKEPFDARILSCKRAARSDLRTVVLGASMRPVGTGTRLELKAELFQKSLAGGKWTLRSDVPGLGAWTTPSDPSIGTRPNDVYKYRQAVGRLVVPYSYRFKVSFRWSDESGTIVREASTTTSACREPDLRPDLTISEISVDPVSDADAVAGIARYTVVVRNGGRSQALNVGVGADFSQTRTIRRLGVQESIAVSFFGPACPAGGQGPAFTADPSNLIDESRETNNIAVATCPATLDGP
jgi:hypothetical protein